MERGWSISEYRRRISRRHKMCIRDSPMTVFHITAHGNREAADGGIQKAFHRGIEAVAVNMQYCPFHKPSSKTPPVKYSIAPKVAFSQQVFYGKIIRKKADFATDMARKRRRHRNGLASWDRFLNYREKTVRLPASIPS